ncbi:MAG: GFA family protein [Gammaproteobacteria bacterium]|nr:GFA family protein [Gammaproteobacteria bacterium]
MYSGSCLCGDIAFVVDGPIEHVDQCHCSMCRKAHGAAFATYGGAASEDFRMLRGESLARSYRSSPIGRRVFCPRCGSVVPVLIPGKPVAIALGNVEPSPAARPKSHFFVGSKAPWRDIVDDLPQYDEYPPSFGFDASSRGDRCVRRRRLARRVAVAYAARSRSSTAAGPSRW